MFKKFSIFTRSLFTFEGKNPYEETLTLLYRHWFVLLGRMIGFLALLILPIVIIKFINPFIVRFGLTGLITELVWLYLLTIWYAFFYMLTMYLLDVWVVTDHRIIDSKQKGYFNRTVSELNLEKIQDVSVHVRGFIQTLLNFGDVEIQTAGTEQNFVFKQVPYPGRVKDLIMQAHRNYVIAHRPGAETHDHVV